MIKALLIALLEPTETLKAFEQKGNYSGRLALMEELKSMPFGAVWDHYCAINNVPVGMEWFDNVMKYEQEVLLKRK